MTTSVESLPVFRPTILDPNDPADARALLDLRAQGRIWDEHDHLGEQIDDLLDARRVGRAMSSADRTAARLQLLAGLPLERYGRAIHYPWSGTLVRLLPPAEFQELRLDRNRNKITGPEQRRLLDARIGVVGLSVGNAVALTLAQEGVGGRLKLADFDALSLSNINRVRATVAQLGLPKVVIAARQIAELNPYMQLELFPEGLTEACIDAFLDGLDVVVDECDGLRIKVLLRLAARARRLPVVMETSDRGMLDVERFDLEPGRPLLHGRLPDLSDERLRALTADERLAIVAAVVGDDMSTRAAASMLELGTSLSTWPQLASDVAHGGATVCVAVRRIVLGERLDSGRRYLDTEGLLQALTAPVPAPPPVVPPPARAVTVAPLHRALVEAAVLAPSGGNCQPWRFHAEGPGDRDRLWVVHDRERSRSMLDADGLAGLLAVGAAIEAMSLRASQLGHRLAVDYTGSDRVVASVRAEPGGAVDPLAEFIDQRFTDRRTGVRTALAADAVQRLTAAAGGAVTLRLVSAPARLDQLAAVLGDIDRLRLLHPTLHREMWREVRWSDDDAAARPDGISVGEMNSTVGERALFRLLRRPDVADSLRAHQLGGGLVKLAERWLAGASAAGLFTIAGAAAPPAVLAAGRAIFRVWLAACKEGLALHPIGVAGYMIRHLGTPLRSDYSPDEQRRLADADAGLLRLFDQPADETRLMIVRLLVGGERYAPSFRRPVSEVLFAGLPPPDAGGDA